jgi:hypothetical protein
MTDRDDENSAGGRLIASCACGGVALELTGKPIVGAVC